MNQDQRYKELDFLRAIAVLSMVLYHLCFDLAFFYGWDIPVREGIYSLWARGTAMTFLMVIGICFTISWKRNPSRSLQEKYPKYLHRGLTVFLGGMVIYFVTYLIVPGAAVKFGILHLIGVSAMLQPLFARFGAWNAVIGVLWTIVGLRLTSLTTESVLLFPFGIVYPEFYSLDYYPLFPWFGTVLMGMAVGSVLYVPERVSACKSVGALPYPKGLLWIGRRALPLYFVHQPILFVILALILGMPRL